MLNKQITPALFLLLVSCGGGSGSADVTPTPEPITPPASNSPPTFPATEYAFEVQENSVGVGSVTASDPDGDQLEYVLSGSDSVKFSIDNEGYLSFLESPDFEAPTDADSDNEYDLVVAASDNSISAEVAVTVTVSNDP